MGTVTEEEVEQLLNTIMTPELEVFIEMRRQKELTRRIEQIEEYAKNPRKRSARKRYREREVERNIINHLKNLGIDEVKTWKK